MSADRGKPVRTLSSLQGRFHCAVVTRRRVENERRRLRLHRKVCVSCAGRVRIVCVRRVFSRRLEKGKVGHVGFVSMTTSAGEATAAAAAVRKSLSGEGCETAAGLAGCDVRGRGLAAVPPPIFSPPSVFCFFNATSCLSLAAELIRDRLQSGTRLEGIAEEFLAQSMMGYHRRSRTETSGAAVSWRSAGFCFWDK